MLYVTNTANIELLTSKIKNLKFKNLRKRLPNLVVFIIFWLKCEKGVVEYIIK